MEPSLREDDKVARLLVKALRALPERDRDIVTRHLLISWLRRPESPVSLPGPPIAEGETFVQAIPQPPSAPPWTGPNPAVQFLAGAPPTEAQIVPIRLPEAQHRALKTWSGEHGFSMASVIRVLVERFLEGQGVEVEGAPTQPARPAKRTRPSPRPARKVRSGTRGTRAT
jgi:hypothetical protein